MRRALVAVLAVVVTLALAAPASTATPSPKVMAAQIKALQKQVKQLRKQLATTQAVLGGTLTYAVCNTAATADAFQSINATAFTPVTDFQACSALRITRQPGVQTNNVFQQLLNIFKP